MLAIDTANTMTTTLPRLSVRILRNVLSAPGWAKKTEEVWLAGKLLCEVIPEDVDEAPEFATKTAERAWCQEPVSLELTEKQREVCKTAVKALIAEGRMAPGEYSYRLIGMLGLGDE